MHTLVIVYIVVQFVCLAVGVALFAIVANGTSKPKCSCPNGANVITGKSCKDLAGMPELESYCKTHCGTNTTYINACSWSKSGQYGSCVKCRGLNGSPATYWSVGTVLIVLPAVVFIPMIIKNHQRHNALASSHISKPSTNQHHSQQG